MKHYWISIMFYCMVWQLLPNVTYAQKENHNWCFRDMGISFNTSPPHNFLPFLSGPAASVSDAEGNLLFYTDSKRVRDKNHNTMPNGLGLSGSKPMWYFGPASIDNRDGTIIIVGNPSNKDQYYIITTDPVFDTLNTAYYTLVDMSLNYGQGDVVPNQKNVPIATGIAQGVTATKMDHCEGYWIIVHERNSANFLAFRLDWNGFSSSPVVSSGIVGAGDTSVNFGSMCFNPSGDRFVRCSAIFSPGTGFAYEEKIESATFDKVSGRLTNFIIIDSNPKDLWYPVFSPNGSKLYCSGGGVYSVNGFYQYDLSLLPDVAAVQNSKIMIDNSDPFADSRIGPDGKLHIAKRGGVSSYYFGYKYNLGVISYPDSPGLACSYHHVGIPVPYNYEGSTDDLGSDAIVYSLKDTVIRPAIDTNVCFEQEVLLLADSSWKMCRWSTGSTQKSEIFRQNGTYWVYGIKDCTVFIDTFHINFLDFTVDLGNDTSICPDDTLLLDAELPVDVSYFWSDGSSASHIMVDKEGIYYVSAMKGGCITSDTISVSVMHPYARISPGDTIICEGTLVTLHASAYPESNYLWNTGSVEKYILAEGSQLYTLTATNVCGIFQDSSYVAEQFCICPPAFVPNAFSPNGDGINDILQVSLSCHKISAYLFVIYNRYGQKVFETSSPGLGWNGFFKNKASESGTYYYLLRYKDNNNSQINMQGDILLIR